MVEDQGAPPSGSGHSGLRPEPASRLGHSASVPNAVEAQQREWTRWDDQRPPNERGSYRYRASFPFLGLNVTAEWTEEMHLCGMGYGDSEWWPLRSCYWDGFRRYITVKNLEWSPVLAYDPESVVWHGVDLLPCPFTGKAPTLEPVEQFIGAPLWRSEAVYISSPGVPRRRWRDAKSMRDAWNTRVPAQGGEARQGGDSEASSVYEHPVGEADAPQGGSHD